MSCISAIGFVRFIKDTHATGCLTLIFTGGPSEHQPGAIFQLKGRERKVSHYEESHFCSNLSLLLIGQNFLLNIWSLCSELWVPVYHIPCTIYHLAVPEKKKIPLLICYWHQRRHEMLAHLKTSCVAQLSHFRNKNMLTSLTCTGQLRCLRFVCIKFEICWPFHMDCPTQPLDTSAQVPVPMDTPRRRPQTRFFTQKQNIV